MTRERSSLETKLRIADKVESELRKAISILEGVNRTQAQEIERLHLELDGRHKAWVAATEDLVTARKAIERKDEIIAAQNRLIVYRGERLSERGY